MKIKRILTATLLALFLVSMLTGCIIIPRYKYYNLDANTVSSIQIYDLWNLPTPVEGWFLMVEPIYTIPADTKAACLEDFSNLRFNDPLIIVIAAVDPSFDLGPWTVRINYTDGSFEFLSNLGYGEQYHANGKLKSSHHYGCDDSEAWEAFIVKYLPEAIYKAAITRR